MNSMMLSPFTWAIITYLLVHALGSKRGTLAIAGLHTIINELATAPPPIPGQ